MKSLNT